VESTIYRYSFQPYLISLPNNNYYKAAEGEEGDDTWIYDLVNNAQGNNAIGLKPAKEDLYGSLVIEKDKVLPLFVLAEAGNLSPIFKANDGRKQRRRYMANEPVPRLGPAFFLLIFHTLLP